MFIFLEKMAAVYSTPNTIKCSMILSFVYGNIICVDIALKHIVLYLSSIAIYVGYNTSIKSTLLPNAIANSVLFNYSCEKTLQEKEKSERILPIANFAHDSIFHMLICNSNSNNAIRNKLFSFGPSLNGIKISKITGRAMASIHLFLRCTNCVDPIALLFLYSVAHSDTRGQLTGAIAIG